LSWIRRYEQGSSVVRREQVTFAETYRRFCLHEHGIRELSAPRD